MNDIQQYVVYSCYYKRVTDSSLFCQRDARRTLNSAVHAPVALTRSCNRVAPFGNTQAMTQCCQSVPLMYWVGIFTVWSAGVGASIKPLYTAEA